MINKKVLLGAVLIVSILNGNLHAIQTEPIDSNDTTVEENELSAAQIAADAIIDMAKIVTEKQIEEAKINAEAEIESLKIEADLAKKIGLEAAELLKPLFYTAAVAPDKI